MKKLHDGTANLIVRHKIVNAAVDTNSEKTTEVAAPSSVASSKKSDLSPTSSAAASAAAEQQLIEKTKVEAKR
jgi:hypothetical protein